MPINNVDLVDSKRRTKHKCKRANKEDKAFLQPSIFISCLLSLRVLEKNRKHATALVVQARFILPIGNRLHVIRTGIKFDLN